MSLQLEDPTQILELHIGSSSVRLYDETLSTANQRDSICLLKAPLHEFLRYSRQEMSKWLIDLAHDICDPANLRGSLSVWKEPTQDWHAVAKTDPLTASVYRYQLPPGIIVDLAKMSTREGRSVASTGLAQSVTQRDEKCWVSGCYAPVKATQICPKRVGDNIGQEILRTFANLNPPPTLSISDGIFRLTLSAVLDIWFREYLFGLRPVSPDIYECHLFARDFNSPYTVAGQFFESYTPPLPFALPPALHGHRGAPPHPQSPNLPPPGLFRWHYLQCVLRRFAHEDYKSLANIRLPELSLRMEGDSDDEGTDSEFEWPSKAFDVGRDVEHSIREEEKRRQGVVEWIEAS